MKTAVLLWSVPLFIIAQEQSLDTRELDINNNNHFTTQLGGSLGEIQDLSPVDNRGCKGGKGCKCCIPVCGKINNGSTCVARQSYWGDCPADMHYSPGSCQDPQNKICCKKKKPDGSCKCERWGYEGRCGERGWSQFCSDSCAGSMQSPINLYQQNLEGITGHEFIYTNYEVAPDKLTCQNNGHYAKCFWNSTRVPTISGGNLTGTYVFDSMHWHIGCEDGIGSDHTRRNESYSGELHVIHYKNIYKNISMALDSGDQDALAVFGVFIQVNETNNPVYDAITENLVYINSGGEEITFSYNHTLSELLPTIDRGRQYYRYYGSLTHPSCNEVVVWTVFQKPSFMSSYQIRPFRCMKTGPFYGSPEPDGLPLCNNHRQIQPENGRKITLWVYLEDEP